MFVATETPSTIAMLAGLEGLIAAMKNRRPKLRAVGVLAMLAAYVGLVLV